MSGVSTATVIAGIGAAGSLASAGAQIFGGMQGSAQQGQAAALAGMIGERNAQIAEQDADLARKRAASDADDIAVVTRKAIGAARADAGASGLVIDDGSPLEAILETASVGELNKQRRIWEGEIEYRDHMLQAESSRLRGAMGGMGQSSMMGSILGAGSSLLTGASRLAGMFDFSGGGGKPATGGTGP